MTPSKNSVGKKYGLTLWHVYPTLLKILQQMLPKAEKKVYSLPDLCDTEETESKYVMVTTSCLIFVIRKWNKQRSKTHYKPSLLIG